MAEEATTTPHKKSHSRFVLPLFKNEAKCDVSDMEIVYFILTLIKLILHSPHHFESKVLELGNEHFVIYIAVCR